MSSTTYNYTIIDPVSGGTSISAAINNAGEIAGTYIDPADNISGFIDVNGVVSSISDNGAASTDITAVNDGGSFTGYSLTTTTSAGQWFVGNAAGQITDYADSGSTIQPVAINASGIVVGNDGNNGFSAVSGAVSVISVTSSLGTTVAGINAGGEIVGSYEDASGVGHGFTDQSGVFTTIDPSGSADTVVTAINAGGVIAGEYVTSDGNSYGFVDAGGTITQIDPDGSQFVLVAGINDSGVVAGNYLDANFIEHGFVDSGGVITTIDPAGSQSTFVGGINDLGQVVGTYDDANNNEHTFVATPACFCPGTLITTDRGPVPVEDLAVGDCVMTVAGPAEPIRWIGRRSYAGRFLRSRPALLPVRITAGALGHGLPHQDLVVSPAHALYLQDVLVPAAELVNGATILREPAAERVDYIHLELARHEVIWANGAPAETFVDDDSRAMFANAAEFHALYPDAPPTTPEYCAPRVTHGFALDQIRHSLATQAAA